MKHCNMVSRAACLVLGGILWSAVSVNADVVTVNELREAQEQILNWRNGEESKLLSGELLDDAGASGSDWYAFGVSRMGIEEKQDAYLSRLQGVAERMYEDVESSLNIMKVTDWNRMAITAAACGGNPEAFGENPEGNSINLIADGSFNCIFEDPGKQGINGYIWALLALDSKNYQVPEDAKWTREKLVDMILSSQKEDGGFGLKSHETSGVDITAMALTALAPYSAEALQAADKAFEFLSSMQQNDGTMVTDGERTSESTGWTMIALCSWDKSPFTDEAFIKEGKSLYDGYQMFLMDNGSMIHSLDGKEPEEDGNFMSGYQALYALEACIRQIEGRNRLFDLTDAKLISQERIDEAGKNLPELVRKTEKDKETAIKDIQNRTVIITAVVVIILLIMILLLAISVFKKKRNMSSQKTSEEEEDEW